MNSQVFPFQLEFNETRIGLRAECDHTRNWLGRDGTERNWPARNRTRTAWEADCTAAQLNAIRLAKIEPVHIERNAK